MTMIFTRRLFIFGAAAALALPAVTRLEEITDAIITKQAFQATPDGIRKIYDLTFLNGEVPGVAHAGLYIGERGKLLDFQIGRGGRLYWVAVPGNELIVLPHETFRLDVEPCGQDAHAEIAYEADGKIYLETFDFLTANRAVHPMSAETG